MLEKAPDAQFGAERDIDRILVQMVVKSDAKQLLSKLNTLLLVDDWYGTGTTMFAVQFLLNSLTEKPLATECATPGIAQDQHALEGKNAINNILTAMKNNSQSPPAAN